VRNDNGKLGSALQQALQPECGASRATALPL